MTMKLHEARYEVLAQPNGDTFTRFSPSPEICYTMDLPCEYKLLIDVNTWNKNVVIVGFSESNHNPPNSMLRLENL